MSIIKKTVTISQCICEKTRCEIKEKIRKIAITVATVVLTTLLLLVLYWTAAIALIFLILL